MRLICPKCEARYDLDPALIPPEGREVECSGCGHIWFQRSRPPLRTPQPLQGGASEASKAEPPDQDEVHLGPFEEDEGDVLAAAPPRRKLNESLLAVLREEAEREAQARLAEAARFEFQDELPLPQKKAPAPKPAAEPAVEMADVQEGAFAAPTSLPDPVALGATLDGAPEPVDPDLGPEDPPLRPRSSFWPGFWVAVLIWAALAGSYLAAPDLAEHWPSAEPALQQWTQTVDMARQGLGSVWERLRAAMTGSSG